MVTRVRLALPVTIPPDSHCSQRFWKAGFSLLPGDSDGICDIRPSPAHYYSITSLP